MSPLLARSWHDVTGLHCVIVQPLLIQPWPAERMLKHSRLSFTNPNTTARLTSGKGCEVLQAEFHKLQRDNWVEKWKGI